MDYGVYKRLLRAAYAQLDSAQIHNDEEHYQKTSEAIDALIMQWYEENVQSEEIRSSNRMFDSMETAG